VKEAIHIKTGKYYACKVINKKLMEGREHMVSVKTFRHSVSLACDPTASCSRTSVLLGTVALQHASNDSGHGKASLGGDLDNER